MAKQLTKLIFFLTSFAFSQQVDSLNNSNPPLKSIESKVVEISATLTLGENRPSAFKLSLFSRISPSEVLISRMFFPGDTIQVILPEDILSEDTLGNVATIEPIGGSYEKLYRLFTKSSEKIDLGNFKIEIKSDIIKLSIIDGIERNPIPMASLKLFYDGKIIFSGKTDSMGYRRLRVPVNRDSLIPVSLRIDTGGNYPLWQENLEVPKGSSSKEIPLYKLHLDRGESIYKIVKDLSPFRKGPENGSETLFFLNSGDLIAVNKVAGDRMFGKVRIDLYEKQSFNYFEGWVLTKHAELVKNQLRGKIENNK